MPHRRMRSMRCAYSRCSTPSTKPARVGTRSMSSGAIWSPRFAMSKPLYFGIVTDQIQLWPTLLARWQYFEALGFDSIWDSDHFFQPSWAAEPNFEAWTVLAALAAS